MANQFETSPFVRHQDAIVLAASVIYQAEKVGEDPDPDASRVALAQNLGDATPEALRKAQYAEAQLNVGARAVAQAALLLDQVEQGGVSGLIARGELGMRRLIERPYLKDAFLPGGAIDRIRGYPSD